MLTKRTLLCCLFAALLFPATPAWSQSGPPVQINSNTQSIKLKGQILDAETQAPLTGVYIRQQDALNAVFSEANGQFELTLKAGFAPMVIFEAEGYESVILPFSASQDRLKINLQALKQYTSDQPPAHSPEPEPQESRIIAPNFNAIYQFNYTLFRQDTVGINGLVLNEFGLSTELMPLYPLAFRGRFFRSRMPVDVANFNFNPAFYINHLQAKVGAGWIHNLEGPFDLYLGGDLMLDYRSPDNRNPQDQQPVAFTGSLLDREQTRAGLGFNALLGWQINDRLALYPEATLYPLMMNFVDGGGSHYTLAADLGAKLRFEIMQGFYATGAYYTQLWYGFGPGAFENNHFLQLGISIDPWTLAEKLQ